MNEKDVKNAFNLAEKEIEAEKKREYDKQVEEVKEIVKRTLTELESLKAKKQETEEKIKVLKLDLDDLKQGKLELIKERQDKSDLARSVSVILIKERVIRETVPSPWYTPWQITWNVVTYPQYNRYTVLNNDLLFKSGTTTLDCYSDAGCTNYTTFTLNNSVVKDNTIGSYQLEDKTINLR